MLLLECLIQDPLNFDDRNIHKFVRSYTIHVKAYMKAMRNYLVISDFPTFSVCALLPFFIFDHCVKFECLFSFCGFNNWRDEFSHESGHSQERRPKVVNKVDDQSFDV